MLTKKLPFILVLSGWLIYTMFDDPGLRSIVPLHWAGLYIAILGFLLIPFYHMISVSKKGDKKSNVRVHMPRSILFYIGAGLLILSALSYRLTESSALICSGKDYSCLGPFFFFTIPSAVLAPIFLLSSLFSKEVK